MWPFVPATKQKPETAEVRILEYKSIHPNTGEDVFEYFYVTYELSDGRMFKASTGKHGKTIKFKDKEVALTYSSKHPNPRPTDKEFSF